MWRINLWRLKKLIYERDSLKEKHQELPLKGTIFTANFWKLIVICDSQWLSSRPVSLYICFIILSCFHQFPSVQGAGGGGGGGGPGGSKNNTYGATRAWNILLKSEGSFGYLSISWKLIYLIFLANIIERKS